MKKSYLFAVSLLVLTTSASQAADWGGYYFGAQLGKGKANSESTDIDGLTYGVTGGHNWVTENNFLIGLEASWMDGGIEESSADAITTISPTGMVETAAGTVSVENLITVGPRLGFIKDNLLIYGEGGFASARISTEFDATSTTAAESISSNARGYFLGADFDYAISEKLNFGAEYNRVEYNKFDHGDVIVEDSTTESILARVTYKFPK